jgi:hypothetical protein
MSQIVSSLPNKFEQGIFAALCFDFSLSKNLVIYIVPSQADHFLFNISLFDFQFLLKNRLSLLGVQR